MGDPLIPVTVAGLLDRITISQLKCASLKGVALRQLALEALQAVVAAASLRPVPDLPQDLRRVTGDLRPIQEAIRGHPRCGDFGEDFIAKARAVHCTNDHRAALKPALNQRHASALFKETSALSP